MEASLSFLVKDRHLDRTKRRWIRANVKKRECVSFFPVTQTGVPEVRLRRVDEDTDQTTPCRCGRLLRQHVKNGEFVSVRDYRLFSEEFPTDVYVEVVNAAESRWRPITYAPKQVVRLAADSEPDVLRQLIGQVWRMPKANFLVSLHGTCEPEQRSGLSDNLKQLLATFSNPGNTILTVSSSDPNMYQLALKSCEPLEGMQLPSAEIIPVAFLQWSELSEEEKEVLLQATAASKAAEDSVISSMVATLKHPKGYFLLTDYGVHAEPGSGKADYDPHTGPFASTGDADENGQPLPESFSFSVSSEPAETEVLRETQTVPPQTDNDALTRGEVGGTVPDRNGESEGGVVYGETEPLPLVRPDMTNGVDPSLQASYFPPQGPRPGREENAGPGGEHEQDSPSKDFNGALARGSEKEDHEVPPASGFDPKDYGKPPRQDSERGGLTRPPGADSNRREIDEPAASAASCKRYTESPQSDSSMNTYHEPLVPNPKVKDVEGSSSGLDSNRAEPSWTEPVSDRGHYNGSTASDFGRKVPEVSVSRRNQPAYAMRSGPRQKMFNFSFPNPLRRRVETVLRDHAHDTESHGSLMILSGSSSFLDLAAVHGAILSGVPVIVIKSTSGEASMLLNLLKEMEEKDSRISADLVPDGRPFTPNQKRLELLIERNGRQLADYDRYKGQMFRVVRDILAHRHMLTVCEIDDPPAVRSEFEADVSRLVAAAVEAFIKSLPKEEAVVFFRKNTLRLASEDDEHPVKKAQKAFQCATLEAAVKLNRPELLDVIVQRGFVQETDVFKSNQGKFLSDQELKDLVTGDSLPVSQIKDLQHFQLRKYFIEHVCKLKRGFEPLSVVHQLFVYAVLNGRTELAKHFWRRSLFQDQVANALIACHVSTYLAAKLPQGRQANVFHQQAVEFKGLAKGTLNDCYIQDPEKGCAVVRETAVGFSVSPIQAAIWYNIRPFVDEPASSDYLDSVWTGRDQISFLKQERRKLTKGKCMRNLCDVSWTAPRTKCFVFTFFFVLFLALYSYTLIFETGERELTPFDIALIVWALSFLVEEIQQFLNPSSFLRTSGIGHTTIKNKMKTYFSDTWNILDVVSLSLFLLGYALRVGLELSEAGHVLLSVDLLLFFFRLLRVLTVSRTIGPMLPMIWNMLGDLIPFLVILFVFVLAYAVASEALLHPGTSWNALYLLYLPRVGFWPIFGEYGLDTIDGGECSGNSSLWYTEGGGEVMCPSRAGRHVVPVLLGLYILMTNVLMLNLLIAYFNHSFERVHKESNVWWAWLRCGLIEEFYGRPALPPPFTLLYRAFRILRLLMRGLRSACCILVACLTCTRRRDVSMHEHVYLATRDSDGSLEIPMLRRNVNPVEAFMEEGDMLDVIDLEEFRFSALGRQADRWDGFERSQEMHSTKMSMLKRLEASKANAYLLDQAAPRDELLTPRSSKGKKQEAEMEDILTRMEKKIEDNKERLKALNTLLKKARSFAREDDVLPSAHHDKQDDAAVESETESETM